MTVNDKFYYTSGFDPYFHEFPAAIQIFERKCNTVLQIKEPNSKLSFCQEFRMKLMKNLLRMSL